ncbi:Hsp20/alpha crystallin family protein [Neobacillus sp. YX16]|jgi:HSP20 family molecular chaperone IbpA|uniref:Hsp20/alpha crystallin family protein n=1 Tax=Neobacillus sp. YX16 TaxID=3047874 RepID=UPI0024C423A8|nr:Hsp20/alpha crystallin family protein [Neobacillus sp. YX16]WHZ00607.1 Hsp20/alpha crystallin family protein [Neobacillus sp. YX16]
MKSKKNIQPIDFDLVEKWLENYCLDPLTTQDDLTQFRIDLYETDQEWIVEALLNEYNSSEIKVFIEDKKLIITADKSSTPSNQQKRVRTIQFPFQVINQKVTANYINGILEVLISKSEKGLGKNCFITLP